MTEAKPKLSVVLCTYNNAASLKLTLQQLLAQRINTPSQIEIILVNNNSTDQTEILCQSNLENSQFSIHYLYEVRQGLSHARNTGVEKASGEYILFTDDDAELPDYWLSRYLDCIEKYQSDCLYSSIHVLWDQPKPWWYQNGYRACFVELNYGETTLDITDVKHEFFGKNFCVKKNLLLAQGGFDPALGRLGSKLMAGEETLLYRNLIQAKCKVLYFPHSPVGHRLKPKEYTEDHIKKLFIDGAYSALHIAKLTAKKRIFDRPLGILVFNMQLFIKSALLFLSNRIQGNRINSFYQMLQLKKSMMTIRLWIDING
jgi:glycosyltransferase involved in cell wall biosynthesis